MTERCEYLRGEGRRSSLLPLARAMTRNYRDNKQKWPVDIVQSMQLPPRFALEQSSTVADSAGAARTKLASARIEAATLAVVIFARSELMS
jgi:hypothetical protein